MSTPESTPETPGPATREEVLSALFAGMVIQQTNLALMLLGRVPHPETGQTVQDLDGARLMIDQLEMLEAKTKGNLSEPELRLLRQNLTALQMAFVAAVEKPAEAPEAPGAAAGGRGEGGTPEAPPAEEESKRKFSKKY